ncbi:prolipoprotein diacylglyceryl transferase [Cellulomonas sp. ACRRI]|uniref:prolipoprotein diacylglyceryl transferase n=1 Tax=Cellulomonas sp. ACRRI TaxID=2918188 RepID=UPI001EF3CC28|nr:prolipoprotein diacylglyceryl transferase [Cellulomonas sp. ACRRI]MCG7284743.1 prolipoprotein diacylglyceryl transferase [Cellulomonas sp. ACRRI]
MRPVLFSIFGLDIQTYGVSKAAAAFIAAYLLGRAFSRLGIKRDSAHSLVLWATVWGFVGAKVYFVLENLDDLSWHHLGGMGFTWYGGLISGTVSALVVIRRHRLPLGQVAGATAIPLTVAYGVGRLGCFFAGDGTYGKPSDLPWAMAFPHGAVPSTVPVHPTPLYDTLAAFAIAAVLWWARHRLPGPGLFGGYLVLSGAARFAVEFLRVNTPVVAGLTQPQLWSMLSIVAGVVLLVLPGRGGALRIEPGDGDAGTSTAGAPAVTRNASS